MSGYRRPDGGKPDPAPFSYRVEIVIVCREDHVIVPFYRLTLPGYEHEGVMYDRDRIARGATLDGAGPDWDLIGLRCGCGYRVRVSRKALEARLAAMWAPGARRTERVTWDSPDPPGLTR